MLILGIETSCDETGAALYDTDRGLLEGCTPRAGVLAHALHSQIALHDEYGGVVPELASRDHIRRLLPLVREVMDRGGAELDALGGIAYTEGPGLAGALLVGAISTRYCSEARTSPAARSTSTGRITVEPTPPRRSRVKPTRVLRAKRLV